MAKIAIATIQRALDITHGVGKFCIETPRLSATGKQLSHYSMDEDKKEDSASFTRKTKREKGKRKRGKENGFRSPPRAQDGVGADKTNQPSAFLPRSPTRTCHDAARSPFTKGKSKTRSTFPLPSGPLFGGIKRIGNFGKLFGRDPGPEIADHQLDRRPGRIGTDFQKEPSAFGHRLPGIDQQIDQYLLDLIGVGRNFGYGKKILLDADPVLVHFTIEKEKNVFGDRDKIGRLRLGQPKTVAIILATRLNFKFC